MVHVYSPPTEIAGTCSLSCQPKDQKRGIMKIVSIAKIRSAIRSDMQVQINRRIIQSSDGTGWIFRQSGRKLQPKDEKVGKDSDFGGQWRPVRLASVQSLQYHTVQVKNDFDSPLCCLCK
jgi:hypothetical protein